MKRCPSPRRGGRRDDHLSREPQATELARGRMDDDHVAARRRFGEALEKRARRARRIDEADREAARCEVGDLRRQDRLFFELVGL